MNENNVTHAFIKRYRQEITDYLGVHLNESVTNPPLLAAMRYSVLAGGKRLRPLLLLAMVQTLAGKVDERKLKVASSLELLHTYSLIHDDLPAMDNDDLRRGLATNHKKFGEALAILAGDGLLTLAFEWLADSKYSAPITAQLTLALAQAAGPAGMVAGQVSDVLGENQQLSFDQLKHLHKQKTGALIAYTAQAAGIITNSSTKRRQALDMFAENFGLAFQIYDDLQDVLGTTQSMGKAVHKDAEEHKNTYPGIRGLAQAKRDLMQCVTSCQTALVRLHEEGLPIELLNGFLDYFQLDEEAK
ncbi:polyprenyl synthetase family protein [Pediococcus siamensis]|uniref:polyprenyl synthetase family protein n=1 Tax=Pediococcus siamensis TaxID=381829 RepID=UPI0039A06E39